MKRISRRNWRLILTLSIIMVLVIGTSVTAFGRNNGNGNGPANKALEGTLYVTYDDGETESYRNGAPFNSNAMHFHAEYDGVKVVSAYLEIDDGETVYWEGHGGENADLSMYLEGYWHWVYTPSGILTISDSEGYPKGKLCVTKVVDLGDVINPSALDDETFDITITGPSYPEGDTKSIGIEGGKLCWDNLIPGDYWVTEDGAGSEWNVTVPEEAVDVESSYKAATATVTNTYVPGSLKLKKVFNYDAVEYDVEPELPEEVVLVVSGPSYPEGYEVTLTPDKWSAKLNNLIVGQYTVTEKEMDSEWDVTISESPVDVGPKRSYKDIAKVTVTNTYVPGTLKLSKTFDTDAVQYGEVTLPTEVKLLVSGPSFAEPYEVTLTPDKWSAKLTGLLVGKYTITEVDMGSEWDVTISKDEVRVKSHRSYRDIAKVSVTNTYVPGWLKLTKDFVIPEGYEEVMHESVTLLVSGPSFANPYEVELSEENNWSAKLIGLIVGEYTITEADLGSQWDVVVSESPVNVGPKRTWGDIVRVTVTNTYTPPAGDDETAWAAHDVAKYRYNEEQGNWATYVNYAELEVVDGVRQAKLYAGQHMLAGYVTFSEVVDGEVTIAIYLYSGWNFKSVSNNVKIQDYAEAPSGNPSPGQFEHKTNGSERFGSITVPANNYYGVHVDVVN